MKNPNSGKNLELDGYCEELGIAFEHHGIQHYKKLSHLKNEVFQNRVKLDKIKIELCEKAGINLLIIPDILNILKPQNCLSEIYTQLTRLNINFSKKEDPDFYSFLRNVRKIDSKLNILQKY